MWNEDNLIKALNHRHRLRRAKAEPEALQATLLRLMLPEQEPVYLFGYPQTLQIPPLAGMEKIGLEIPPDEKVSPPVELKVPSGDYVASSGLDTLKREHLYAELKRLPAALAVNANFDEGIIDSATGYAKADSSDENLKADRDMPWKQVKAGELITTDLHQGWFGLSPDAFEPAIKPAGWPTGVPWDFYQGASLKIRKLVRTDEDTETPESGQVRFWVTQGDGATAGAWAIDAYDRESPTFTPIELVGKVYGPDAEVPAPAANVRYWVEGLTPGKCTLEFTCIRDGIPITHEQTFLVATQKTKTEWLEEIRQQIMVQNGGLVDLDEYLPTSGWRPKAAAAGGMGSTNFLLHTKKVAAIYDWYAQLYREKPEKLDWMGAASQVGGAVYAGLCDIHSPTFTPLTYGHVSDRLMGGQILIYRDLGWQHRAWLSSGMWALNWVAQHENTSVNNISNQSAVELETWQRFDQAIKDNNWNAIKLSTRDLVRREQAEVIVPMWTELYTMGTALGNSPVFLQLASSKARNAADVASPSMQQVVPYGKIYIYEDRSAFAFGWAGGTVSPPGATPISVSPSLAAKGVFRVWWGEVASASGQFYNAATRLGLVQTPLLQRAAWFSETGDIR